MVHLEVFRLRILFLGSLGPVLSRVAVRAAIVGGRSEVGHPRLDRGRAQHDREADQQQDHREREHPVGEPHVVLEDIHDFQHAPRGAQVEEEHLPHGAAAQVGEDP